MYHTQVHATLYNTHCYIMILSYTTAVATIRVEYTIVVDSVDTSILFCTTTDTNPILLHFTLQYQPKLFLTMCVLLLYIATRPVLSLQCAVSADTH
jgi:hypothetical protein